MPPATKPKLAAGHGTNWNPEQQARAAAIVVNSTRNEDFKPATGTAYDSTIAASATMSSSYTDAPRLSAIHMLKTALSESTQAFIEYTAHQDQHAMVYTHLYEVSSVLQRGTPFRPPGSYKTGLRQLTAGSTTDHRSQRAV
ncbi:hypothetical protein OPT61_g5169 [Boeremia exigua]|uniref:Uncharacterized protein n=1 Tax=Boeremia exigua TaxID=749465 RepID=A0ACC2IB81_9PLEO|nr:hypothetical protein OPT61_g5169 [Boeremia exigua]